MISGNILRRSAVAFALVGLAACAPPQSAETTASAKANKVSSARDGRVLLQSRDAPGLAGKWSGEYTGQNGFRGQTTLTLTAASADSVDGVFEYRWGSGNYVEGFPMRAEAHDFGLRIRRPALANLPRTKPRELLTDLWGK